MSSENILTNNGIKNIANKLSGYISFLNREKDATQFSQPIIINVPILMTHINDDEVRKIIYLKLQINKVDIEVLEKIKTIKEQIKIIKEEAKFNEKNKLAKESNKCRKCLL